MQYTKITIILQHKPPFFIGSQLRGAFGYAFKNITCINPSFSCENCFAQNSCLYYSFYEQKNSFHKYRFDFDLGKSYYDFSFYLFDDTTDKLPYIISSFNMMLTQIGLGRDKTTFKEFDIFVNDSLVNKDDKITLPKEYIKTFIIDNFCPDITLHFITPLRIKKNNKFLRDDNIELKDIINSIYQRQMKLLSKEYRRFPYEIKGNIIKKDIRYKELTRKSNRQKTMMNLGGIMGNIEIKGLNKECYDVLKLAELIGVGKSTVFGLGKIEIKDKDE